MKRILLTTIVLSIILSVSVDTFAARAKQIKKSKPIITNTFPWAGRTKPVVVPFRKPCNYKQYLWDQIHGRIYLGHRDYRYEDCDGDGENSIRDGGTDCNDNDDDVFVGADEIPYDGKDNDCVDGDLVDVDGDGFDSVLAGGTDCDDNDALINPDASDTTCDNVDNDCSGVVDDGVASIPADNTNGLCASNIKVCVAGEFVTAESNYVPVSEVCDGLDNDCAGGVDDGLISRLAANQQGACSGNIETCEGALGW
ncbi:MAG: putative metal-binding motif-containing protein, partial [Deltaproteobacteria bacterium]|nr:putative metal-binding motif-containing protein [Deltaproteobacteria bacterium]